jgi:hypothetical protein
LNTYKYALVLFVLMNSFSIECQNSFLSYQYKNLKKDLELIKKCYVSKSPVCTANERLQAGQAVRRVLLKSALIIVALGGAIVGGKYLLSKAIRRGVVASRVDDPGEKERMLKKVQDLSEKIAPQDLLRDYVIQQIGFINQLYWNDQNKAFKAFVMQALPNNYEEQIKILKENDALVKNILAEVKKLYPEAVRFAVTNGGTISGPMSSGYTIFELTPEGELKVTSVAGTSDE